MNKLTRNQIMCGAFLMAVALIMYLLNVFTPLFCDDWHYVFIWGTHTRIQSISDIVHSQWIHYFDYNGRAPVHSVVQLFDGLLGKEIFNVFNAIIFGVFLYLMSLLITDKKEHYIKILPVSFMLVFLFMSGFKHEFLWLSGSVNYLWSSTLILSFLLLLNKQTDASRWTNILLFFYSILCGWSHEGLTIPLAASLFFYFVTHRKLISQRKVAMMVGFLLGTSFLVFSPASIGRFMTRNAESMDIVSRLINMRNVGLFYILLFLLVVKICSRQIRLVDWYRKEQVFIVADIIAFIFIALTGVQTDHSRFSVELFSLILILRLINWDKINTIVLSVLTVVFLGFVVLVIHECAECHAANESELSQITSKNCIVETTQPIDKSIIHRYALDYTGFETVGEEKLYGYSEWVDYYYYMFEHVNFFPKEFLRDLKVNPDRYNQICTFGKLPFYAKRTADSVEYKSASIRYEKPQYELLPSILHPICRKVTGEPDEIEGVSVINVSIDSAHFVLIPRGRPDQDKRLKSIRLE